MLKYVNTGVVFQEIPDEVTLAINISNCPCRCPGCHSSYLWQNVGTPLTAMELDNLIRQYEAEITCVAFMGGDSEPEYINNLARFIHREHPELKVAWYSGRQRVATQVKRTDFDYIKLGPYIAHLGCLKERSTNVVGDNFTDITHLFWK